MLMGDVAPDRWRAYPVEHNEAPSASSGYAAPGVGKIFNRARVGRLCSGGWRARPRCEGPLNDTEQGGIPQLPPPAARLICWRTRARAITAT